MPGAKAMIAKLLGTVGEQDCGTKLIIIIIVFFTATHSQVQTTVTQNKNKKCQFH